VTEESPKVYSRERYGVGDERVLGSSHTIVISSSVKASDLSREGVSSVYLLGRDVINYVLKLNQYDAERYGYQQGLLLSREVDGDNPSLKFDLDSYEMLIRFSRNLQIFLKGLRDGFEAGVRSKART